MKKQLSFVFSVVFLFSFTNKLLGFNDSNIAEVISPKRMHNEVINYIPENSLLNHVIEENRELKKENKDLLKNVLSLSKRTKNIWARRFSLITTGAAITFSSQWAYNNSEKCKKQLSKLFKNLSDKLDTKKEDQENF